MDNVKLIQLEAVFESEQVRKTCNEVEEIEWNHGVPTHLTHDTVVKRPLSLVCDNELNAQMVMIQDTTWYWKSKCLCL